MSDLPEDPRDVPANWNEESRTATGAHNEQAAADETTVEEAAVESVMATPVAPEFAIETHEPLGEQPALFESFTQPPPPPPPARIPHLGHLLLVAALGLMGLAVAIAFYWGGISLHLFGVTSLQQAGGEIHYILGSELVIYLVTLGLSLLVFPEILHKSLFDVVHWNGATALRLRWRLVGAAFLCFVLAFLNGELIPGPKNTPIEKVFRTPGAAWLLFAFGVAVAPFFEEMFFRGFLLPAVTTATDWIAEKVNADGRIAFSATGRPIWPFRANTVAALTVLSVPTAIFLAFYWRSGHFAIGILLSYSVGLLALVLILAARKTSMRELARPIDANGEPLWSISSMIVGSVFTSLPFAAMHGDQTGYALSAFLLLVGVSLVLCSVRLATRSLASSVLVHACYNFLLFSLMLIGTGGFRHLDRM
jgi:uncharacterized protein